MPEGKLGFDRRFADSVLMYRVTPGARVPLGRDEDFTNKFLNKMKKDSALRNRDSDIHIYTQNLPPEERKRGGLGMVIDEEGVVEIELTNPPALSRDELEDLKNAISQRLTQTFSELNYDQELVNVGGELVAKVNGPLGGPRPFVESEIVVEGLYTTDFGERLNARQKAQTAANVEEYLFDTVGVDKRIDITMRSNMVIAVVRDNEIDTSDARNIWGSLRDIQNDIPVSLNAELTTITYKADGAEL